MSGHELRRIEVLSEVLAKRRTEISAAAILGLSTRQMHRLVVAYRVGGGGAMIHKARGRTSNNQLIAGIREYVIELVRSRYADFGPSLAAEVLLTKDGVKVSRETLRKWMVEEGLWLSRRQRRSFHQPRLRRESFGRARARRPISTAYEDILTLTGALLPFTRISTLCSASTETRRAAQA